jgi:hypothetical protein
LGAMMAQKLTRRISVQALSGQPVDMAQVQKDVDEAIRQAARGSSQIQGKASVEQTAPGALTISILIYIAAPMVVETYKTALSIIKQKYFVEEPEDEGEDDEKKS